MTFTRCCNSALADLDSSGSDIATRTDRTEDPHRAANGDCAVSGGQTAHGHISANTNIGERAHGAAHEIGC